MATRAANANKNPMDLEVSSDEEAPPKPIKKRKKKHQKTQEEIDAEEQKRDDVLAAVSHLEEEMVHQNSINDNTPHASSTAKHVSRVGSYVAPDPQPAHTKPTSRPSAIFTTTDDDSEEVQRRAKKAKQPRGENNSIAVKQVVRKASSTKATQKKKDVDMMVSAIESYLNHILTVLV